MKTINPYIIALKLLIADKHLMKNFRFAKSIAKQRYRWDRHPCSRGSREKLLKIRNIYVDQKCVILCNGPSLLKVDFDALRKSGVYTFGLNKINLLFDKTEFRPNAIVAVNPLVLEQNLEFYKKTSIPLFVGSYATDIGLNNKKNFCFLHSVSLNNQKIFAEDCSLSIYQGYTVTFVALQLAFHMGFKKVALVGADHYFQAKGKPNEKVRSGNYDPNHFDPNYFSGGVKWNLPDLYQSEISYKMANRTFAKNGRQIYNCTEGGYLEIFKRKKLLDFLVE